MSGPLFLEAGRATLPEIRDFVARVPFAIVPLGSTEQHGPHLPTSTDTLIAERMALETARLSRGLVVPALPLGYAWVWRDIPGTLTLSFDTYMRVVRDIADSLDRWGIKAVFFISGHGSNPQPLKHALRELIHDRLGIRMLYGMYGGLKEMTAEATSKPWADDFHAEEIETALMLAIAPDLVHMDRAAPDYPPVPADYGRSELSMGDFMRSGVFGDPTPATRDKGERWIALGAARSAALWTGFLARHGLITGEA
ncbi:creatininase family protein [Prosthecomicrobium pneumaticum]|uniref:Creatinine amidohydrolase n=1 Tax=Prosthecomicrobium pneumaticum TaxID=81895 RepID=A0A7W9CU15_9HYPH|nr:creatinine amidohydrolase [Prosthecomicrobium pneumaticum]